MKRKYKQTYWKQIGSNREACIFILKYVSCAIKYSPYWSALSEECFARMTTCAHCGPGQTNHWCQCHHSLHAARVFMIDHRLECWHIRSRMEYYYISGYKAKAKVLLLDLQWTHLMHIISLINLSYYSIISLDILILFQTLSYSAALRHHACAVSFILWHFRTSIISLVLVLILMFTFDLRLGVIAWGSLLYTIKYFLVKC